MSAPATNHGFGCTSRRLPMTPRDQFRAAHSAVRSMQRAVRLPCATAGKGAYYATVLQLHEQQAARFFPQALRCNSGRGAP